MAKTKFKIEHSPDNHEKILTFRGNYFGKPVDRDALIDLGRRFGAPEENLKQIQENAPIPRWVPAWIREMIGIPPGHKLCASMKESA